MIKRKAPKDMSSSEFVDYVEAHLKKNLEDINGNVFDETVEREIVDFLRERLEEPAPNPFTPDQIAVMRELQKSGYLYVAQDFNDEIYAYTDLPKKTDFSWTCDKGMMEANFAFLKETLCWQDEKPLYLPDYAPLDGEPA